MKLIDIDGENLAVRAFLTHYSCDEKMTVGSMFRHMRRSGWKHTTPVSYTQWHEVHLSKSVAQQWIRHLFSLEVKP